MGIPIEIPYSSIGAACFPIRKFANCSLDEQAKGLLANTRLGWWLKEEWLEMLYTAAVTWKNKVFREEACAFIPACFPPVVLAQVGQESGVLPGVNVAKNHRGAYLNLTWPLS